MLQTVWAIVKDSKIEVLENITMPEGAKVLITFLPNETAHDEFWLTSAQSSLKKIWDNTEDDVYAELLKR